MFIQVVINVGVAGAALYACSLIAKVITVHMICKTPKLSESKVESIIKLFHK